MICKDQVFVTDVVVIDPTREMMATNVINQPTSAVVEFNTIAKIHKYRRFHEGHHFIPMAMDVHDAPKHDMDHFIKECALLFHNRWLKGHLSLSFCIHFLKQCVSISLQRVLASVIKRKILLAWDIYSKPLIIIKPHDLHVGDIRRAMGEIASYHEKD